MMDVEAYRVLAKRRLARIAAVYAVLTAVMVVVNVQTHGPSWWYFAAGGFALALLLQALRLRRL
jgi:hypothetical protein